MASRSKFPSWIRHSGAGLELAGATAGLALGGFWIDGRFGTRPWGLLVGVFIGIVGGLYNLVRDSMLAAREAQREDASSGTQSGASSGRESGPEESGQGPASKDRTGT